MFIHMHDQLAATGQAISFGKYYLYSLELIVAVCKKYTNHPGKHNGNIYIYTAHDIIQHYTH